MYSRLASSEFHEIKLASPIYCKITYHKNHARLNFPSPSNSSKLSFQPLIPSFSKRDISPCSTCATDSLLGPTGATKRCSLVVISVRNIPVVCVNTKGKTQRFYITVNTTPVNLHYNAICQTNYRFRHFI
jgi:hypothetical protein